MNCKKCGSNLEVGAAFCGTCGAPVNVNEVSEGVSVNNNVETTSLNQNVPEVNENKPLEVSTMDNGVQSAQVSGSTPIESAVSVNDTLGNQFNIEASVSLNNDMKAPNATVQNPGVLNNNLIQGNAVTTEVTKVEPQTPVNAQVNATQEVSSVPQNNPGNGIDANASVTSQAPQVNAAPQVSATPQNNVGQANGATLNQANAIPSQPAQQPQISANNGVNPQAKKNKTPFFIAAGGMGAVMVLLICLIASGGIKLNFTVSKGGEKQTSDNQTISQEKKDEERKTEKNTTTTTERTTERTTVNPVSNSGTYLDFRDMSVYIPDTFESDFDKEDKVFQLYSNAKTQMLSMQIYVNKFDEILPEMSVYKDSALDGGARIVSEGTSTKNGLKYYYLAVADGQSTAEVVLMEVPSVGCLIAQIYTDYATESAYLDTLYEIAFKTKSNSNSSSFAPDSNSPFATEFKKFKEMTHTFE